MHDNHNTNETQSQYGCVYIHDIELLKGCSGAEGLVFMVLCLHAFNGQRVAFPSVTTIQNITDLSRASVLRALKGLRNKGAITNVGKTPTGVNKYALPRGSKSDTSVNPDTSSKSATPTSSKSDTSPVANLQPIKHKVNNNIEILASSASYDRDVLLFVELWNKWYSNPLCLWESSSPLVEFQNMRTRVLASWQKQGLKKDMYYELQVCDIYLMQSSDSICGKGPYRDPPIVTGTLQGD